MSTAIATGRFAPSPTGELHLGSLVAATASYLNIKQQSGRWLLRMDDIDHPRMVSGSREAICRQLEAYGFEWDKLIIQSERLERYQDALTDLTQHQWLYSCRCSRKQIQHRLGQSGIYGQFCRHRSLPNTPESSLRIVTPNNAWHWHDFIQGSQTFDWISECGDYVIRRADGIFAYHFVAALDDSDESITEVIRGADLMHATAPQQYIQQCLNRSSPRYGHHALLVDEQTQLKLSKASRAPAIKTEEAVSNLYQVLVFLNQEPPSELKRVNLAELWQWAIKNWSLKKLMP